MSKRILIVGAGGNQISIIQKAREMGLTAIAVDGNAQAPGFPYADIAEAVNILDPNELVRVAQTHRADGIYPTAELAVEAVAEAATRLGLPGAPPEVATRVRSKLVMRQVLKSQGIPGPAFRGVHTLEEAQAAAEDIGLPIIVKPADGNASRGVTRVDTEDQLPAAFAAAFERARAKTVLLESFMEGEEFNVDGLVYNGAYLLGGITAKERSQPPNRFDLGIYMPPLESPAYLQSIADSVRDALAALEFTNGTTHAEVIMAAEGPRIVEIAGRPGGGRIATDLIQLTYGMDYMADSIRIALGDAPQGSRHFEKGTALFWIPAQPGAVTALEGIETAKTIPGVREIVMSTKPGDVLEPIVDCVTRDHVGYVLTVDDTVQGAVAAAKAACAQCRVVTQPK